MALGLRGRFTLGFGLAAVLTIAAAAAVTREIVASRSRAEFARTLRAAEADAERVVRAQADAVRAALDGFADRDNPIVGAVLIDLVKHEGELSATQRAELKRRGEVMMKALGADVLVLVDRRGVVLAAPHFTAAVGGPDPMPARLARGGAGGGPSVPAVVWTRVLEKGAVQRRPVLAAARTVEDGGESVTVMVGRVLGPALLTALHRDGSVEARLVGENDVEIGATEAAWAERLGDAPSRTVALPGPDGKAAAQLTVAAPTTALDRALGDITLAAIAFGVLAGLLATIVGWLIARRITRDLDALVDGALAVARGDLEHKVTIRRKDELGELAFAFNTMTSELRDSKDRLVQAERVAAWQDIAKAIAHEIKNPLTPIQMSMETLRKSWAAKHKSFDEIFEESTTTVLQETARLKRIVGEFSQFARLPRPAMQPTDLNELVGGALALYKGSVRVVSELAPDLPQVSVDRDQITQVVLNLLENARDAIASKGSDESVGRIAVRTRRTTGLAVGSGTGGGVELEVDDNGPGFDPAIREKLFEPYYTTKSAGTGLGLAIVRRIVNEHGGRVAAASEPGQGARFTIELPLR